ncbi:MAG: TVP38/TMEM64 family protein [Gemmataceae bacterium]
MSPPRLRTMVALAALSALIGWVAYSYASGGVIALLLEDRPAADKVADVKHYFDSWGSLAPLIYFLLVTVEVVVAPIPGTLMYLPGGAIFGGGLGGALALAGNVCGAGIACVLARSLLGPDKTQALDENGKLKRYQDLIEERGLLIIALLRVNPLTSSDLVSYAAGLTRIRVRWVMLGTLLGMAPLCFAQSYFAAELLAWFPWLIWPLVAVCLLYVLLALHALHRMR